MQFTHARLRCSLILPVTNHESLFTNWRGECSYRAAEYLLTDYASILRIMDVPIIRQLNKMYNKRKSKGSLNK